MDAKPSYQSTMKHYPFNSHLGYIPNTVRIEAMLEATHRAFVAVYGLERNAARTELFWVTYNFEFRKIIERWIKAHADKQERLDKT